MAYMRMEGITKYYPESGVLANRSVDFEVQKVQGEVGEDALEVVNRGDIDIFHLDTNICNH